MKIIWAFATLLELWASAALATQPNYQFTVLQQVGTFGEYISKNGSFTMTNNSGSLCAPDFTCQPIPIPDGASFVYAANLSRDASFVSGSAIFTDDSQRPILFDGSQTLDLGVLIDPDCPTCNPVSNAFAVNNAGQVVGASWQSHRTRAFFWQSGVMTDIGSLGGTETVPAAINEHGHVVGRSLTEDGTWMPIIYREGKLKMLKLPLGANNGLAVDLNDQGKILIQTNWDDINGSQFYIYEHGAYRLIQLPAPFNNRASLRKINNRGLLLGQYFNETVGYYRAFIFDGVNAYDLNDCIGANKNEYEVIYAYDFNNKGQILIAAEEKGFHRAVGVLLTPQ